MLAEERGNIERLLTAISATLNRDLPTRLQVGWQGFHKFLPVGHKGGLRSSCGSVARYCSSLSHNVGFYWTGQDGDCSQSKIV